MNIMGKFWITQGKQDIIDRAEILCLPNHQ